MRIMCIINCGFISHFNFLSIEIFMWFHQSPSRCSTDTQNRWWYRIIQIGTIWSTCFSEDHIEKYGKILFSSLIYTVKILPCLTVLHWLLISLSAFSLARKFLYIIILLKLAFSTTFFMLFSTTQSCWSFC